MIKDFILILVLVFGVVLIASGLLKREGISDRAQIRDFIFGVCFIIIFFVFIIYK